MKRPSDLPVCEVIPMPLTQAEIARNRLQAALDEYDTTGPAPGLTDTSSYSRWTRDTAARLGCTHADAYSMWQATMLGTITQAARTLLEETTP